MTLTACQKDEGLVSDGATSQTITVTIPQGMQTRATAADFGNGAKIDRCLLQIYHSGTTPAKYGEQQSATVQKGADGKLTATFNLRSEIFRRFMYTKARPKSKAVRLALSRPRRRETPTASCSIVMTPTVRLARHPS